ncbi:hypothetical protein QYF36_014521 [Acer negundo]|nr:hypothetical protein QYF36_014521 [Acer negundo]
MDFEKFLKEFDVEPKNPSEAAIRRWRSAVSIVKNGRRRLRMTADLDKHSEADQKKLKIQPFLGFLSSIRRSHRRQDCRRCIAIDFDDIA